MEKKYVNEEEYQKVIHTLKIARIILVLLGAILIILGITLLVLGINQEDEGYPIYGGHSGYINTGMVFGGASMLMVGIVMTFIGGAMLSMIIHRRAIMGLQVQAAKPIVEEGYQEYKGIFQEAVKDTIEAAGSAKGERAEDPDLDHKFCKYCGNVLENDAVFCEFCGKKLN